MRIKSLRGIAVGVVLTALSTVALAACGGGEEQQATGEVTITCTACQKNPTDPFLTYDNGVVERFNKKYAGRYRVKVVNNQYASPTPERLQYYQRLALADDLPDLMVVGRSEGATLLRTGKLMDFGPWLQRDASWRESFHQDALDALKDQGRAWAIPQQRDAVGIFYNKRVLAAAGVKSFPQTWDELDAACEKVKAIGDTCIGMDGDWATLLMWTNLVGTQPGGAQFLSGGIADGDYAGNEALVKATERLKDWHLKGYVNKDAFTGDFTQAGTPFVEGRAAFVANGPWYVPGIKDPHEASKGLYADTGYEASPGWTRDQRGVILTTDAGWASGAKDERKQEAVVAFLKMMTSHDEALEFTKATGSYPPVKLDYSKAERRHLEPLAAGLVDEAAHVPLSFPLFTFKAPSAFESAWRNLWPAYVKGSMDTDTFLSRLGSDATSTTG
jgi:raffinose/stachyose/melibiose transport system substrate-binding protein